MSFPIQAGPFSDREIDEALQAVFAEGEFQPSLVGEALRGALERILEWFSLSSGSLSGLGETAQVLVLLALTILLALLLTHIGWTLTRGLRAAFSTSAEETPEAQAREDRVAETVARAREAARRGDLVGAMRAWFEATVIRLGRTGSLECLPGFTHREILDRGHATPEDRRRLEPLVLRLDRTWFGGAPATPGDLEHFERVFDEVASDRGPAR